MTIIRIIEINNNKKKSWRLLYNGNLTAGRHLPKFSKTKIILFI